MDKYNMISYMSSPIQWLILFFGLCVGSFLNVCILRIPLGTFLTQKRSTCPNCSTKIPFYYNIPLLSFLFLFGKSACCKKQISYQYPFVELLFGILSLYLYSRNPFIRDSFGSEGSFYLANFIRFFHEWLFCALLVVCSGIDFYHMIIPDKISIPMILAIPLWPLIHPELGFKSALLGMLLGAGVIYTIAWIYYLIRGEEGVGMGDAKLLAAIGGWLGVGAVLPTLFYASIIGSVCGVIFLLLSKRFSFVAAIPFGPFLALGALIYLFSPYPWIDIFLFKGL